jgi:glycosyltransferase involved in cell wall biosynthesis
LRVLISAYACEPNRGSEPGAGWEWAMAATERHEVCLVTSRLHAEPVRAALAEHRPANLLDVVFLEDEVDLRRSGRPHLRHWRWQRAARPVFERLHAEHDFDLAHHLTWAVDWHPAAAAAVPGLPYVWGPVGGSSSPPWRQLRWLGGRGLVGAAVREAGIRPLRRLVADPVARRSALVLALNEDVRRRFRRAPDVEIAPNCAIRRDPAVVAAPVPHRAVFAGRLLAWKGVRLAVAAIAQTPDWELEVYGAGPDQRAAERLVDRLGVADRVTFHGRRPRSEVLDAVASAEAFLFPSLRDASSWAVAEAVTFGVPVVCVDVGGPPVLIRSPEAGVAVPPRGDVPRALAAALDDLPRRVARDWWLVERLPDEIDRHYRRAVAAAR